MLGTIYSFPDLKEDIDRTRIIIFATDNAVDGKEIISLKDACKLCKQYGILVYAYCPTYKINAYVTDEGMNSYKNAIEIEANGNFYTGDLEKTILSIINEVKETKKSVLKTTKKTYINDYPTIPFIIILIIFINLSILEKRIKI